LGGLVGGAEVKFFDGMGENVAGMDARLSSDLVDDDIARFLSGRQRLARVAVRHTVGLTDKIEGDGGVSDVSATSGARFFKLKLGGDPDVDCARLARIGRTLAALPYDYRVSVDAN